MKQRTAKYLQIAVIFLSSFTLVFIIASLILVPHDSGAAGSSTSTDVNLNVSSVINLATNTNNLTVSITPLPDSGVRQSGNVVATVNTNSASGYRLTMSSRTTNNSLTLPDASATIPSTANTSAADLAANTWGYNTGASATTFLRIPLPASPAQLNSSSGPASNAQTTVTYAARVNTDQKPGTYTQEVTFTATTN